MHGERRSSQVVEIADDWNYSEAQESGAESFAMLLATSAPRGRAAKKFAHRLCILVAAGIDSRVHLTRILAQHSAHEAPAGLVRDQLAQSLNEQMDEMAERVKIAPDNELDEILDEGMRSARPDYRPIK